MYDGEAVTASTGPTSKYANINGLRLHYLDWGGAPARLFVLCHGGSAHAHWWDSVAPRLTAHGRVLALDFRGHGRSEWAAVYGPANHIADLKSFLADHLQRPVVLVGHSMGGEITQRVAYDCPELVASLVVVDAPHGGPPLRTRLMWRWKRRRQHQRRPTFATREDLVRRFRLSPPGHNLTADDLAALALKGAEQLADGTWAFRFDPRTRRMTPGWKRHLRFPLKKIKVPTLILRGEHSALLSPRVARRMHRQIRHSQFREIPRAHHHVPLDNPHETAAAIIAFVSAYRGLEPLEPFAEVEREVLSVGQG
ncbi:MAG TPA: alpha/beta hydrolase [Candidatus Binataceae bacterium]|nr:alpha/beta hydrolase [Candidatus Binataceae bacterium]